MPEILSDILLQGGALGERELSCEHINKDKSFYNKKSSSIGRNIAKSNKTQQSVTFRNITFEEPGRDETLFHLANHLVKGRMPVENIWKYMEFFGQHCTPPFSEKDIPVKIESALKRAKDRNSNLTQRIREWISATSGNFNATFLYNELQIVTSGDKAKARVVLCRLVDDGLIERTGSRAGEFRIIEPNCEPVDWQNASTDTVDLWLPFGLGDIALIPPGGIINIAGEPNSGKTALLLNIAKENQHNWNVHYFSSELGPGAFKRRMSKFSDFTVSQSNIHFYQRADNFADVIKKSFGNLYIIDYLEIHENFYLVSKHLSDIYKKLNGAVAVVALQKGKGRDDGHGGTFTREKPILSLAVSPGKAKITKLKEWREGLENPNGKEYHFKLIQGCKIIEEMDWHKPEWI